MRRIFRYGKIVFLGLAFAPALAYAQNPICSTFLQKEIFVALVRQAVSQDILPAESLKAIVASPQPINPLQAEIDRPLNIAVRQAFIKLMDDPQLALHWPAIQQQISALIDDVAKEEQDRKGASNITKRIISPLPVAVFPEGWQNLDTIVDSHGDLLVANVSNKGTLQVIKVSNERTEVVGDLPEIGDGWWVPGWHREKSGKLSLWLASENRMKLLIKKMDWDTKQLTAIETSNHRLGFIPGRWKSAGDKMFFLVNEHHDATPNSKWVKQDIYDPIAKGNKVIYAKVGPQSIVQTKSMGLLLPPPQSDVMVSYLELRDGTVISASLSRGLMKVEALNNAAIPPVEIRVRDNDNTFASLYETADHRLLVALTGETLNLRGIPSQIVNVFEPLKSIVPLISRPIEGLHPDPGKFKWFANELFSWFLNDSNQLLLSVGDMNGLSIINVDGDFTDGPFLKDQSIQQWINYGKQIFFWGFDKNLKLSFYKLFNG